MTECASTLNTVVNVALTAVIAFAAIMQWIVSGRLLNLQKAVEDQRTKTWLFFRLKPTALGGHGTAQLEVSNLSQVGVWLEKVTLHLEVPRTPNKAIAILIETVLSPMHTKPDVDIRAAVHELVEPKGRQVLAIVSAEVEFWANGLWRQESTNRYSMLVDESHLLDVKRAQ
jgi:hypothetical protein